MALRTCRGFLFAGFAKPLRLNHRSAFRPALAHNREQASVHVGQMYLPHQRLAKPLYEHCGFEALPVDAVGLMLKVKV